MFSGCQRAGSLFGIDTFPSGATPHQGLRSSGPHDNLIHCRCPVKAEPVLPACCRRRRGCPPEATTPFTGRPGPHPEDCTAPGSCNLRNLRQSSGYCRPDKGSRPSGPLVGLIRPFLAASARDQPGPPVYYSRPALRQGRARRSSKPAPSRCRPHRCVSAISSARSSPFALFNVSSRSCSGTLSPTPDRLGRNGELGWGVAWPHPGRPASRLEWSVPPCVPTRTADP
jgi:hypothetical protein